MPKKYIETDIKPKSKKLTRSVKLRKYGKMYNSFLRKEEQSHKSKSPRLERNKEKTDKKIPLKDSKPKKRPLNNYQKFVQKESKTNKYKNLSGKERLKIIAQEWKLVNKK